MGDSYNLALLIENGEDVDLSLLIQNEVAVSWCLDCLWIESFDHGDMLREVEVVVKTKLEVLIVTEKANTIVFEQNNWVVIACWNLLYLVRDQTIGPPAMHFRCLVHG